MIQVKTVIHNMQKAVEVPQGTKMLVRRCCMACLQEEGFEKKAEVDVSLLDNWQIEQLNAEHRRVNAPTDVLSFPLGADGKYDLDRDTGAYMLGDIVISMEKAVEQAREYGHSLSREIGFLTVHAMLHLLGYDHETGAAERLEMRRKEEAILSSVGLARDDGYGRNE